MYCRGQGATLSCKGSAELPDRKHCTVPQVGSNSRCLKFREKYLYLLSHGGVLFLIKPGVIEPLHSSPKSSSCSGGFYGGRSMTSWLAKRSVTLSILLA